MSSRPDFATASPNAFESMLHLGAYLAGHARDTRLRNLVELRVSQINGSEYCTDLHWELASAHGESRQRLQALKHWRESSLYSEHERAALAWAEALTRITDEHVPDAVYEGAREQFSDSDLADLALVVVKINGWNRLCIAFRAQRGRHQSKTAHAPQDTEAA